MNVSETEYYIGQALAGLLATRGDNTPDDAITAIAEKAVKIGRATQAAAVAARAANQPKIPNMKISGA